MDMVAWKINWHRENELMELVRKRKRNQPAGLGNPLINQQDEPTSASNQIQPFDQLNPSLDKSQNAFESLEENT